MKPRKNFKDIVIGASAMTASIFFFYAIVTLFTGRYEHELEVFLFLHVVMILILASFGSDND